MRARVLAVALLLVLTACGSGGEDETVAGTEPQRTTASTTSTTTTTSTTEPPVTLTADARRFVSLCTNLLAEQATMYANAFIDESHEANSKETCDEASAYLDSESPEAGTNIPNTIAVQISGMELDLSVWAAEVIATGQAATEKGFATGATPNEAFLSWKGEMDDLLAQLDSP